MIPIMTNKNLNYKRKIKLSHLAIYLLILVSNSSYSNTCSIKSWDKWTCKDEIGRVFYEGTMDEYDGRLHKKYGTYYWSNGNTFNGSFDIDSGKPIKGLYKKKGIGSYYGTFAQNLEYGTGQFSHARSPYMSAYDETYKQHKISIKYKEKSKNYENGEHINNTYIVSTAVNGKHKISIPDISIKAISAEFEGNIDSDYFGNPVNLPTKENTDDFGNYVYVGVSDVLNKRVSLAKELIDSEIRLYESKVPDDSYKITEKYTIFSNGKKQNTISNARNQFLHVIFNKKKNQVKISTDKVISSKTEYVNLDDLGLICNLGYIFTTCEGVREVDKYSKYEFNHFFNSLKITTESENKTFITKYKSNN